MQHTGAHAAQLERSGGAAGTWKPLAMETPGFGVLQDIFTVPANLRPAANLLGIKHWLQLGAGRDGGWERAHG